MPPRGKVAQLPPEVKAWLDQALVESNFSGYEALSTELAERGFSIGKSALHTYGQGFEDRLSALKMASEQAKAAGEEIDFRLIVGTRLVFADATPDIIAYPATRKGWGRLTRLLTIGNRRAEKGDCILHFADLFRMADEAGLLSDPELACRRMQHLLAVHGAA